MEFRRSQSVVVGHPDGVMASHSRRTFLLKGSTLVAAACASGEAVAAPVILPGSPALLGQGDFRYRVVPGWGRLGDSTPVNDGHGLAVDREGNVLLFTNEVRNNVVVYDRRGRLVHKWGTQFPGAHGMSLVVEGGREVLYLTDLNRHRVFKATTSGEILNEWGWPEASGKYPKEDEYRPSWTLHAPDGTFYVLDGYGRDHIVEYSAEGSMRKVFGGAEGGIVHWGPHGGMFDTAGARDGSLLIAMSDQQHLLRLDRAGRKLGQLDLPGGNPRQIRRAGDHFVVAHLGDNWPKDRDSRGFVSVLDRNLRVVSNVGGTAPEYGDDGRLRPMAHEGEVFRHPHDAVVDGDGSLYVAQFASGRTYPVKLERV